jgi:signal transduction histidine kinase
MLFFFNVRLDSIKVFDIIAYMANNIDSSDWPSQPTQTMLPKGQIQDQRLASLGKFTAKVAHELNNPLDGILRYINLAGRSVESGNYEKLNEYLAHSRDGILRMVKIVRELLEFSRCHYVPPDEPVTLEHIIEDAIKVCTARRDALPVQIIKDFAPSLDKFPAANLFQVFCNLIKNAFEAMPAGGTLEIVASRNPAGETIIEFRDTGPGFSAPDGDALFEPFFTTKAAAGGTGLGLAISKDLLQRHGGRITAANRPRGGCVFTVTLPQQSEPPE